MIKRIVSAASVVSLLAVLSLLVIHPIPVSSQSSLQSQQLSKVIGDVLKAESSGARPVEMVKLVAGLNYVLTLENELQSLTPQDSSKQSQLLTQINATLGNVDVEANQIQVHASHRTFRNHVLAYCVGAFAALLATLIFHYALLLRRRGRVKHVLRMTIVAK